MIEDRAERPDVRARGRRAAARDGDQSDPTSSSTRGRQRSATWPKPSCETEFASWNTASAACRRPPATGQARDDHRQQRRQDVAEAVDQKVRAREHERRSGAGRRVGGSLPRGPSRCATMANAPSNSRMRRARAAAASATSAAPIAAASRMVCIRAPAPGSKEGSSPLASHATAPITAAAAAIRATRPPAAARQSRPVAMEQHQQRRRIEQRRQRRAQRQPTKAKKLHQRDVQRGVDEHGAALT